MKLNRSVVDFHSHILPNVDHGSDSLETSLAQLSLAKRFGIDRIVATSHFYPHRHNVESFTQRRNKAYELLVNNQTSDMPAVRLGAEVLICNNIDRLEGIENLCIQGTKILLLELPFSDFQPDYYRSAYRLISAGFNVILAHADRYDPNNIKKMTDVGAKIQLNADSLSGLFPKKHLFSWLDKELVVALGSDIHMVDKNAFKSFVSAARRIDKYLDFVIEQSDAMWNSSCE